MQQYFCDHEPEVGKYYFLNKEQEHHAKNVLRLENEVIRLVFQKKAYFAKIAHYNDGYACLVKEEDLNNNELQQDITLCMALIKKDKFELILQKAAELGVKRIIPLNTSRTIVKVCKEKEDKVHKRYQQIVLEASQQCKRNQVPEILKACTINDLKNYLSTENIVAYEALHQTHNIFDPEIKDSTTIVIGPEGGFSEMEIANMLAIGYKPISLGKRILRAETAALFTISILAMKEI